MNLNYDCLRDVLLSLEKHLTLNENLGFNIISLNELFSFENLSKYSKEDIYYCVYNLIEVDFINGSTQFADDGLYTCLVNNINYSGHEFLQSIKSETVWNSVKSKLKPVAGLSIPLITAVAKEVIVSLIGIK